LGEPGATPRIIFSVLIGLAAVILIRLFLAFRLAAEQAVGWQIPYVNHIYFTYISLWEGFFIVGLIDLGAPGWVVGAVAVGVLIVGGVLLNRDKREIAAGSTATPDRSPGPCSLASTQTRGRKLP
jgi:hypothetical protein